MYRIRPIEERDKDIFLDMVLSENKEADEGLRQLVSESVWQIETNKESRSNYMIVEETTDSICGYCVLIEGGSTPEIVIDLLSEYQGKGIGEIAIRQLIDINKSRNDIEYFLVRIKQDNITSIKLFKKLGAKPVEHRYSGFMQKLKSCVGTLKDFEDIVDSLEDDDKDTLCFAIYPVN